MKKSKFLAFATLLVAFTINFSSCKKEDDDTKETSINIATEYALTEAAFNDIHKQGVKGLIIAQDSAFDGTKSVSLSSSCATLTIYPFDLTTFPKEININFGTTNCLCDDGIYRRGEIFVTTTGWYIDSGAIINITPKNYYVNENYVEGTKIVTNKGKNANGNLTFDIGIKGKVSNTEGTRNWTCVRQNEWIEGENTVFNPLDDVYMIKGAGEGTTVKNESYKVVITNALRVQASCKWITEGSLTITKDKLVILVAYGDGSCDANATVYVNGYSYPITLGQ